MHVGSGVYRGPGDGGTRGPLAPPSAHPDDVGWGTPAQRWLEVDYFPFEVLHKKWQYYLLTMRKERVGTQEIRRTIDALWRRYRQGFVAYWEKGKVPAGGEGLAYYLAKYVVSPPISLRRILRYDGQRVCYWYNDHKTGKREEKEMPAGGLYRAHGTTHSPQRISSYPLLWSACHLQGQEGPCGAPASGGGIGAADYWDVSHRDAQELPRPGMGQYRTRSAALWALWTGDAPVAGVASALWRGV